jgi:hypothetical protein
MVMIPPEVSSASAVPPSFSLAVSLVLFLFSVPGKSEFTLPAVVRASTSSATDRNLLFARPPVLGAARVKGGEASHV